jgi:hypothetical protein
MRQILAALPTECIGPERLLSLALYQSAHDRTQGECIGQVFRLSKRYGREAVLQHLVLLPDKAYHWILGGFPRVLQQQVDTPEDDLILGPFPYVAVGGTSGWGTQVLAPKMWAKAFFSDAIRTRPLPTET